MVPISYAAQSSLRQREKLNNLAAHPSYHHLFFSLNLFFTTQQPKHKKWHTRKKRQDNTNLTVSGARVFFDMRHPLHPTPSCVNNICDCAHLRIMYRAHHKEKRKKAVTRTDPPPPPPLSFQTAFSPTLTLQDLWRYNFSSLYSSRPGHRKPHTQKVNSFFFKW